MGAGPRAGLLPTWGEEREALVFLRPMGRKSAKTGETPSDRGGATRLRTADRRGSSRRGGRGRPAPHRRFRRSAAAPPCTRRRGRRRCPRCWYRACPSVARALSRPRTVLASPRPGQMAKDTLAGGVGKAASPRAGAASGGGGGRASGWEGGGSSPSGCGSRPASATGSTDGGAGERPPVPPEPGLASLRGAPPPPVGAGRPGSTTEATSREGPISPVQPRTKIPRASQTQRREPRARASGIRPAMDAYSPFAGLLLSPSRSVTSQGAAIRSKVLPGQRHCTQTGAVQVFPPPLVSRA